MNALEWLKERQRQSLENKALFEARPRVAASQAWGGYADKEGGQRLMVRQPEVKNKLVQKRGDLTMTKEWVDNARFQKDSPGINITPAPQRSRVRGIPLPPNVYKRGFQPSPRTLSPEAQAAIAQVQATGGQNVDAYGDPIGIGENTNQAGGWARTSGMWDVPAKAQSMATPRVSDFQPDRDAMAFAKDRERRTAYLPERQVRVTDFQPDVIDRRQPTVPRETWGGDLNLTLPQHPRTRRWIQDPSTILNIGNLIKKMGGTIDYMKGIDDRIKENRDRRFRMFQGDPYSPVRKY